MLKEAIILAGGFGTRLQSIVSDVPKPMAPINNVPFLNYIFDYLKFFKIEHVVLSTGYLSEKISDYYKDEFKGVKISYTKEESPLGTGGGIRLALEKCMTKNILVLNGDSFFDVDLHAYYPLHAQFNSNCTLALRKAANAARYGTIKLNDTSAITEFKEKDGIEQEGLINGGVYILNRELFLSKTKPDIAFSIEKDFFENRINELRIFGFEYDGYFMASSAILILLILVFLKIIKKHKMTLKDLNIDNTWTLFLDRDGVINKKLENDYVKHSIEFEFIDGVIPALASLNTVFGTIVVVTNQQCIGKGIITAEDLELVHKNMLYEISYLKGRIDKIYYSPYLASENHPTRKPAIGMALQAQQDFPQIDLKKSIIIGDSMSDMEFGRTAGMKTVFISTEEKKDERIDFNFKSLSFFNYALTK